MGFRGGYSCSGRQRSAASRRVFAAPESECPGAARESEASFSRLPSTSERACLRSDPRTQDAIIIALADQGFGSSKQPPSDAFDGLVKKPCSPDTRLGHTRRLRASSHRKRCGSLDVAVFNGLPAAVRASAIPASAWSGTAAAPRDRDIAPSDSSAPRARCR
jgi:hypothetical protein